MMVVVRDPQRAWDIGQHDVGSAVRYRAEIPPILLCRLDPAVDERSTRAPNSKMKPLPLTPGYSANSNLSVP